MKMCRPIIKVYADVVHGDGEWYECSNCRGVIGFYDRIGNDIVAEYCPYCGAKLQWGHLLSEDEGM